MSFRDIYATYLDLDAPVEGCERTYWHQLLWLPKWDIFLIPTIQEKSNLVRIAKKFELCRKQLGVECDIVSAIRPAKYNVAIGGAPNSAHKDGLAIDFIPIGMSSDKARSILLEFLPSFMIRMENLPGAGWVHIDLKEPGPAGRYFTP